MTALFAVLLTLATAQEPPAPQPAPQPGPAPVAPMPVPRGAAIRVDPAAIRVDGILEDWPPSSPLLLTDTRQLSGTAQEAYRGPDDLAAQAFLAWSPADLFLAVVVRDDWHRPLGAKVWGVTEIPPADSVVFTFDPARDTRSLGRDHGRSEDREIWLADVEGAGAGLPVLWDRFRGTGRYVDGAALAVHRDEERRLTTFEARVPWREILPPGQEPRSGAVFDLQVVVNDYDEVTDIMPQTRVGWTFGTGPTIDPGLFGSITLLESGGAGELDLPPLPERPHPSEDPVPGPRYWVAFVDELRRHPAAVYGPPGDPRAALGTERYRLLQTLDDHLAGFPRVDYLELCMRIHRRMRREVAGYLVSGVPYFWDHVQAEVRRRLEADPPASGCRVVRLPMGGFVVRSREATFAIDPAGYGLEQQLLERLDFVILTAPLDITKRNDQLLLRMLVMQKPFVTHIGFHLPAFDAGALALAVPGRSYEHCGLQVAVLGELDAEGRVPTSVGYEVRWPDGTAILHSGAAGLPEQRTLTGPLRLLILSAEHPTARVVGHRFGATLTTFDDVLQCARRPGVDARVSLEQALELQAELRPNRSVLLAPGEFLQVEPD